MNVPMVENTLARITISNILVMPFFKNPFNVAQSSARFSASFTFGFLTMASTSPANHPAASNGLREVIGAAIKAVSIDNGCPHAISVPIAEREPFHNIHDLI